MSRASDLPEFERPPVVETVLGVQFETVTGLTTAHLGAFWKQLGNAWPHVNDAPPLASQFERFGDSRIWDLEQVKLRLTNELNPRVQIRNADRDRMIQLQNGRLHYNWLGKDRASYPRYRALLPEFLSTLDRFAEFLRIEELHEPKLNQWEVTYVNHMPKGEEWNEPLDWAQVLRPPVALSNVNGCSLDSFGGEWHYEIPPKLGRLHVEIKHGRKGSAEGQELLLMTLTARGPCDETTSTAQKLDLGHETIVRAFADLTSSEAQKRWGRIR